MPIFSWSAQRASETNTEQQSTTKVVLTSFSSIDEHHHQRTREKSITTIVQPVASRFGLCRLSY
jgi:hypothetical protein